MLFPSDFPVSIPVCSGLSAVFWCYVEGKMFKPLNFKTSSFLAFGVILTTLTIIFAHPPDKVDIFFKKYCLRGQLYIGLVAFTASYALDVISDKCHKA
jgi:hypothetical protein